EVREAAAEWGFTYLTRPNPGHLKKAGNLRFGYEHSDGDFIAIFDADFVPRPEFLLELLPYFDDPSIGIVQSPQFFDSDKRMHWLQLSAGSTQEMFYRWIQTSRDRFDAALNVLLAPLPVIVMLWWLTPMIRPINSFWMSGSIVMALLIYPCVHKSRWRFSVLRVQYLYSFAHLLAIVNHFSGRTKGWVATG